jgi:hypothetical protein
MAAASCGVEMGNTAGSLAGSVEPTRGLRALTPIQRGRRAKAAHGACVTALNSAPSVRTLVARRGEHGASSHRSSDEWFFEDLDRQLGAERGPNGEPSTNDFQA